LAVVLRSHADIQKWETSDSFLWLRLIQSFDHLIESADCIFTYPRFGEDNETAPGHVGCFKQVINWDEHVQASEDVIIVTEKQAEKIALSLLSKKSRQNKQIGRPIHFRIYQQTTDLWEEICKRTK
jgi:hypothetical protein